MALDHEYSLLGGCNRTHVGRWLYVAAAAISAAVVFVALAAVDVAKAAGLDKNLPPGVLSLIGAGTVYLALYAFFDKYGWRIGPVARWLKLPNLAGKWRVRGLTLERDPRIEWHGSMTIVQSWDRLRIHLETSQSTSESVSAALRPDDHTGHHLMYHYRNQPRIGEAALAAHHGFAELTFASDGASATGEYFNGRGRNTFGTMDLTREAT